MVPSLELVLVGIFDRRIWVIDEYCPIVFRVGYDLKHPNFCLDPCNSSRELVVLIFHVQFHHVKLWKTIQSKKDFVVCVFVHGKIL